MKAMMDGAVRTRVMKGNDDSKELGGHGGAGGHSLRLRGKKMKELGYVKILWIVEEIIS